MTPVGASGAPNVLRAACRTWFAAGVRRAARRRLRAELALELQAAGEDGPLGDVVGDDPRGFARRWAEERGLTDRRLRLVPLLPAAMLAGLVGASAVLALLFQAFDNGGDTVLADLDSRTVLAVYLGAGVLAYLAILIAVGAVLSLFGDTTTRATIHRVAVLLPPGAVLATAAAVCVADSFRYDTGIRTFVWVAITVATGLVGTLIVARYLAVQAPRSARVSRSS